MAKIVEPGMLGELNEEGYHPELGDLEDADIKKRKDFVEKTRKKMAKKAKEIKEEVPEKVENAPEQKILSKDEVKQIIAKQLIEKQMDGQLKPGQRIEEEEISDEEQEKD